MPAMDAVAAAGVVGRANHTPLSLPPGSTLPTSPAGLQSVGMHSPAVAPLEAAAQGIELDRRRLGRPLQSGDRRRPGDARLHCRPNLHPRSRRTDASAPSAVGQRPPCSSIRGTLPPSADLPTARPRAVLPGSRGPPRHTTLPTTGSGRLSPRAGQRSAHPLDERERIYFRAPSGQRRPARRRANCRRRTSGFGAWQHAPVGAVCQALRHRRAP